MSDSSLSVFDDTDSDPDFIIDGMRTDSSLSVSDFDEEIYRKLIENDQKVNDNNNSNTCTFSNINKQVTSYNILTYDSDGNNNNNYHFNGFEQNHNIPSTSLCVIEPSSTDEEDNIVDSERKGKKRRRRLSLWNRNKAKTSKAFGLEYTSRSGKVVGTRKPGRPCTCKNKCFSKVSEDDRASLLNIFNNIGEKEKQDTYLCGLIQVKDIVRCRPRTGVKKPKSVTNKFILKSNCMEYNVCKRAFISVYGITMARVDRLVYCNKSNNPSPKDLRGKHSNRSNKIPDNILKQLDDHIKSFPNHQSHYSRESNGNVTYLSPDLNKKIMHNLYLEKYEPETYKKIQDGETNVVPIVSYDFFSRYFSLNYNMSFGHPRTDTCQLCDLLKNQINFETDEVKKSKLISEKELHVEKAELFYEDLKKYQAMSKVMENKCEVLAFDYQQNMPLPHVPAGDVFYKRQLWVYNFCIFSGRTGKSYFYMYNEVVAKKGKNEVISFINHFFNNYLDRGVDTVYIFSDNCSAQNKNHCLVQYLYTVAKKKEYGISTIIHRYPEPGHSFLPCDRNFGLIEKQKRRQERVFLPVTYQNIVSKTCKKFFVINVTQDIILNYSDHFKQKFKAQTKLTLMLYRCMIYSLEGLLVSTAANTNLTGNHITLEKPSATLDLPDPTQKLYNKILPIKPDKLRDVQDLVSKYVPPDCLHFYSSLVTSENADEDEN